MSRATASVIVAALPGATAGSGAWRRAGQIHVTVAIKATFAFVPDDAMTLAPPDPILAAEVHHEDRVTNSVALTPDLAPFLPRADVLLTGSAYAPKGEKANVIGVRLAVHRGRPLLDKSIWVYGDDGGRVPFERIPLVYERAYGGVGFPENPFGTGILQASSPPNLVHPEGPGRVACFAPLARAWPARQRLRGSATRAALDARIAEIPEDFDWTYYQAAPPDQRIEHLNGDEWVVLEGLSATLARVRSRLPEARAVARVWEGEGSEPTPMVLVADTLRIDGERMVCSVVWRGNVPVSSEDAMRSLRVAAGVSIAGRPAVLPDRAPDPPPPGSEDEPMVLSVRDLVEDPARTLPSEDGPLAAPAAPAAAAEGEDFSRTLGISDMAHATNAALPFRAGPPPELPRAPVPGAPRAPVPGAPQGSLPAPSRAIAANPPPAPRPSSPRAAAPPAQQGPFERTITIDVGATAVPETLPFARTPSPSLERPAPFVQARPEPRPAPPRSYEPETIEPPPPRAAPKRAASEASSQGIRVVNATPLALVVVPWALRPARGCVAVIAKATCDLVAGDRAVVRAAAEPVGGAIATDDGLVLHPSDVVPFKVRADVVLVGHAYAPAGSAAGATGAGATTMEVALAFGHEGNRFERRLRVLGDRRWIRGRASLEPSPAEPFVRMPLTWSRAFGGAGYAANPAGVGLIDPRRPPRDPARLPNLEDAHAALRLPTQRLAPACFAPVPQAFRDRTAAEGRRRSLPEELDWTFYQAAPPPQRLAFLRGDEPFSLEGVHRAHAVLEGSLPNVRPRGFALRPGDRLEEIALRLDTVVFDVDAMMITLVWRGALTVADEQKPDIAAIHLATEPVGEPILTPEDARRALR